jgi:hypothetical protein
MTVGQFEGLAKKFDFKVVEQNEVDCGDNMRLTAVLKKI